MHNSKLDLDQQATVANMVAEVILLAPCAGAAGSIGYAVFGLVYENLVLEPIRVPGSAMPAYGQFFGLLAILAGMLGAWTTVAVILACRWSPRGGGAMAILGGVAMGSLVGLLRYAAHSHHGPDPSDAITWHPLMAASVVAVIVGAVLGMLGRRRSKDGQTAKPEAAA